MHLYLSFISSAKLNVNVFQRHCWSQKENELVAFLQLQLAEAINLQDRSLIAHLHETLRCVRLFNDDGCRKLFKSLREDYQKRSPYIAYLIRCRQGLLSTLAHLDRYYIFIQISLSDTYVAKIKLQSLNNDISFIIFLSGCASESSATGMPSIIISCPFA